MDEHRALIEYDFSNSNLHVLTSLAIALGTISLVGASFVLFSFTKFKSIRNKFSFAQAARRRGARVGRVAAAPRGCAGAAAAPQRVPSARREATVRNGARSDVRCHLGRQHVPRRRGRVHHLPHGRAA